MRFLLRFSLLLMGLVCWTELSFSAGTADPTLVPAAALQADLAVFQRAYEALHPGLYRYNSRAQMAENFAALGVALNHDQSLREAYLAFSIFTAKIKCGHSYPNFFNQPKAVVNAVFKGRDKVPFYFRWIDQRMIVTKNFLPDESLRAGTEVLTINGVPVGEILRKLLTVARADGSNDAKRMDYLGVSGNDDFEAFDIYFPLFFPPSSEQFALSIRAPDAAEAREVRVSALSYEERLAPVKAKVEGRRGGTDPVFEAEFPDDQTGVLRMPTWALYDSQWDWKKFLADFFKELTQRHTPNLIIDLRGNEGGDSVGDVILSHLIKQDLRPEQLQHLVRYRKAPDDLVPYLDTWDKSFLDWGQAAVDLNNQYFTLTKYDDDAQGTLLKASAEPYAGRVFVLVDASNSSATFEFDQTLQQNKLGTLVGQPTGGNQRGINGGAFFFLRLPNSKIEIDLPLIGSFPPGERPDAGLQPDIQVQPSVHDIAAGVDTELAAVKKLIQAAGK